MKDIVTEAKRALELAEEASKGPWGNFTWVGKCALMHQHTGRPECQYIYTKNTGDRESRYVSLPLENHQLIGSDDYGPILSKSNAEFIASSRELLPLLANAVIELSEKLKIAEEALEKIKIK